jgi:hypothetical protein
MFERERVPKAELQESHIAPRADPRHGDDGDRGGLGRDDREQGRPGRQVARAEEVIGRAALPPSQPEPDTEGKDEVADDDEEVEEVQGDIGVGDDER